MTGSCNLTDPEKNVVHVVTLISFSERIYCQSTCYKNQYFLLVDIVCYLRGAIPIPSHQEFQTPHRPTSFEIPH